MKAELEKMRKTSAEEIRDDNGYETEEVVEEAEENLVGGRELRRSRRIISSHGQ